MAPFTGSYRNSRGVPINSKTLMRKADKLYGSRHVWVGVHGTEKKDTERKTASFCSAFSTRGQGSIFVSAGGTSFSWFDIQSTIYKRVPIHPPKNWLPMNCAIDTWRCLSLVCRLSVCCALHCYSYTTASYSMVLQQHMYMHQYSLKCDNCSGTNFKTNISL